jgi:uncharacterized membrane protein YhaH (DUF805 family)
MNFDLMFQPLKKYADFNGRARRSEYWLFALFVFVACIVGFTLAGVISASTKSGVLFALVMGAIVLGTLIPHLAVGVRRLHDIGQTGWLMLLSFIPGLGIVLFVLFLLPGNNGPNKYGPDPKAPLGDLAAVF